MTAFAYYAMYTFIIFQDNEPLMRALAKLINMNNPDLVLFVGEALVGNDAVDQLSKFNQVYNFLWHLLVKCSSTLLCKATYCKSFTFTIVPFNSMFQ